MGEINANNKKIKGVIIEAAGNIKQDGTIRTDKDAFVGIRTLGRYESNTGQIIQSEQNLKRRWKYFSMNNPLIWIMSTVIAFIIIYFISRNVLK